MADKVTPYQIRDAIIAMCDRHPGQLAEYDCDGTDLLIVNGLLNLSIVADFINEEIDA